MEAPGPAQVLAYLEGCHYPCDREELLTQARGEEAPDQVLEVLRALPVRTYASPAEVSEALAELQFGLTIEDRPVDERGGLVVGPQEEGGDLDQV